MESLKLLINDQNIWAYRIINSSKWIKTSVEFVNHPKLIIEFIFFKNISKVFRITYI
jgi:hypothetical protein